MDMLKTPTPSTQVTGQCRWVRTPDEDLLVDEAGVVWQRFWRAGPRDSWSGSLQRHETMGDNF